MCGRFVQHSDPDLLAELFGIDLLCQAAPSYNVAPTQPVLAIREDTDGRRELVPLRWGLVPHWSKGPDHRYSMINARAETLGEKPAYREAFRLRRCLIPAEGFYEWRTTPAGKQPFLVRRRDGRPFLMAGLWEVWRGGGPEQAPLESCTIIVTDANDLVRDIHDRMPVILAEADAAPWLDRNNRDPAALRPLLRPADAGALEMHPVSRAINNPRNNAPDLLTPVQEGTG